MLMIVLILLKSLKTRMLTYKNSNMKNIQIILLVFLALGVSLVLTAQTPNWSVNASDYQYTMSVTGIALINCERDRNSDNEIGAFINGSLAGHSKVNTNVNGEMYVYLTIYSNTSFGDSIEFKIYNANTNVLSDSKYVEVFEENKIMGTISNPYEFQTNWKLTSLELKSLELYDYSTVDDTLGYILLQNEIGDSVLANYSFVNDSLGIDNSFFSFNGNSLILEEDVIYPEREFYQIHILATTSNGCSYSKNIVLQVFNTNVPPTGIEAIRDCALENEPVGSFINLLIAEDLTPNDVHTFEFVSDNENYPDNNLFSINYDELLTDVIFDYETQDLYTIQVKVTDEIGNSFIEVLNVPICDAIEFGNPLANNLITPNNDGVNDFFVIPNAQLYTNYRLSIYNDNGNLVYSLDANYNNTWNGLSNSGKRLPSGTYLFRFVDSTNDDNKFQGKLFIERNSKF